MTKKQRLQVWEKYNHHCAYCGREIEYKEMQVDHLVPQARAHLYKSAPAAKKYFGVVGDNVNNFQNLMPSCRRCNHYKRAHSLKTFRALMLTLHKRVLEQYINKVAVDYNIIQIKPFDGIFYFEKGLQNAQR